MSGEGSRFGSIWYHLCSILSQRKNLLSGHDQGQVTFCRGDEVAVTPGLTRDRSLQYKYSSRFMECWPVSRAHSFLPCRTCPLEISTWFSMNRRSFLLPARRTQIMTLTFDDEIPWLDHRASVRSGDPTHRSRSRLGTITPHFCPRSNPCFRPYLCRLA